LGCVSLQPDKLEENNTTKFTKETKPKKINQRNTTQQNKPKKHNPTKLTRETQPNKIN
jgi:uncharacterized membrane protein YfhO